MKVFFYFAIIGFSNTYLVGPDDGGKAILIDPGVMDVTLLNLIEKNNYYIDTVLVTNAHEAHIYGIKTLRKIYQAKIYCGKDTLYENACNLVKDREIIELSGFPVEVFQVMGHSQESMVYKIDNLLFTGDALGAGKVGDSPNEYARRILMQTLKAKILPIDDEIFIFPGHGPPTTTKIEKMFNPTIQHMLSSDPTDPTAT